MSTATVPAQSSRSQKKLIFFIVFFAVTIFVTFMKNREILNPASQIAQHFAPGKLFLPVHAFFASLALVLGAFQFSNRLRSRYLKVHRVLGYTYVTSVFIAAPFAVVLATKVVPSPSLIAASVAQSIGWMGTTAIALYCIRHGNMVQHRRWMLRGYPFAMVFTMARIIIPIPPVLRLGDMGVQTVVWSCIFAAAFLPTIFLDWYSIFPRKARAAASNR